MEVFRRNAQPHIADMRKRGAWGYVPNKQMCVWGPRRIACKHYPEFGIIVVIPKIKLSRILSCNANFFLGLLEKIRDNILSFSSDRFIISVKAE